MIEFIEIKTVGSGMVEHSVEYYSHSLLGGFFYQQTKILFRPQHRVYFQIISGIVTVVGAAFENRRQVQVGNSEFGKVIEFGNYPLEIAAVKVVGSVNAVQILDGNVLRPVFQHSVTGFFFIVEIAEAVHENMIDHSSFETVGRLIILLVNGQLPLGKPLAANGISAFALPDVSYTPVGMQYFETVIIRPVPFQGKIRFVIDVSVPFPGIDHRIRHGVVVSA